MVALHMGPVQAQVVRGQVVDSITNAPVGAGFVVLLGTDDEEITRVLASWDGRFTFHVSPGYRGPFRLRSERIGYRVAETEPFDAPASGTADFTLWVAALPTPLSTIDVRESTECKVRPREDEQTSVVWEEVRKALAAASWTASRQLYHVVSNLYDRDMDGRRRRVRREHHRPSIGLSSTPFVSRAPIELLRYGYVSDEDGIVVYYAPDAEVLQDDGFLDTHCFRLRRPDDETDLIGLAFKPVPSRKLPDVEGVLWLDRQSSELRSLEFLYANLPWHLRVDDPSGGTVEFMPLSSGAWIVHRWRIGIPTAIREGRVNPLARELRRRVEAFRYTGGEVLTITDRTGALVYEAELADLVGVVIDSIDSDPKPLAGATVRIAGTWFADTTDQRGHFRLRAPLDGEYGVTFTHERIDSLGYTVPPREVVLARGRTDTTSLAVPPMRDILASLCPDRPVGAYARALVGTVRDSVTGQPVPGVQVVASWQRIRSVMKFSNKQYVATTDGSGRYTLCGLDFGRPTMVYAVGEDSGSEPVRVSFDVDGVVVGDAFYETSASVLQHDLTLRPKAGIGTLSGIVTDATTGRAIPGAVVTIGDLGAASDTDDTGTFQVLGLSPGTHRLILRRPGYDTRRGEVSVEADQPTIVRTESLALTPAAQVDGTMTELETNRPLAGVWVTLVSDVGDSVARFWSDSAGKIGYAPQTLGPFQLRMGHAVEVDVSLRPLVVGLEPITVTGEAPVPFLANVGFYERRKRRPGVFLDREAIEKRPAASNVGHLLRGMPGVRVDSHDRIRLRYFGPCDTLPPEVWIDGMRIPQGTASSTRIEPSKIIGPGSSPVSENWQEFVPPSAIEAIEVYRGSSEVPVQYNVTGSACGVILIWTRH
jgi:hypothetical protein